MANKAFSRLERLYTTKEVTYGTAVAPTSAACRVIKLELSNDVNLLVPRDKTGTRSVPTGTRGRVSGKWSYQGSLYATGAAGTAPDADVLLQMLFGAAPTVTAATSVGYALSDNIVSADLWSYRRPSTVEQRVALGAIMQNFQFNLGQDIAEWSCDGECIYVLGSSNFASMDVTQKGGLASFPAEPGTPTTQYGGVIAGFTGAITIGGQTLALIRTATIKGNTGNALVKDVFNSFYPTSSEGDVRNFTFSFNTYDEDSAGLAALKLAADAKTPVNATVQVGLAAGNIFTFTVKGIQLASPTLDDSSRSYTANFGDSRASGSSITALDELALLVT